MTNSWKSGLTIIALASGLCVIGGSPAQAVQDPVLHFDCTNVIQIILVPGKRIFAGDCTGPVATGFGTVTDLSTGASHSCNSLSSMELQASLIVSGGDCDLQS